MQMASILVSGLLCFTLIFGASALNERFIENIISNVLNQCYFVQIEGHLAGDPIRATDIPGIHVDLKTFDIKLTDSLGRDQIIRYFQQCVTFIIPVPGLLSQEDLLMKFLSSETFQPQARVSYLILNALYSGIKPTSPELKQIGTALQNFPHRIFLSRIGNTVDAYQFCYFCFQGKSGYKKSESFALDPAGINTIFPDVTRKMEGHTLTFTAPPAPPLVYLIPSKTNPGKLQIVGMQEVILKSMAATLNFTFVLRKAFGGLTGVRFPNGSWNGIMDEVLTGKADIGLSVATSYERNKVFDFTVPVFNAFLVLVASRPSPFFNWEAIFYPFGRNAWMAILVCTILSVLIYRVLHNKAVKLENTGRKPKSKDVDSQIPNSRKQKRRNKISLFQATYFTVGALLEQGYPLKVNALPSRAFVSFWFFVAIVITCAYRSKLFLFLTFPIVEKPPSTFQELAISKYKWGLKSLGGVGLLFITQSPVAHVRYIGEKLEISTDKYSCLDRTVKEKFVCVIYKAYIDYMLELRYWNMKHKFFVSDYLTPPVGSSWVLRKHSPLLQIFDKFHMSQFEMGLADKYIDIYQQGVAKEYRTQARDPKSKVDKFDQNMNYVSEGEGTKPLRLVNLYGPFFILIFGFTVAFASLVAEMMRAAAQRTKVQPFRKYPSRAKLGASFGFIQRKKVLNVVVQQM